MYLLPMQPVINSELRIDGDVEIHPTASLAPGIILIAAPGNRITIGADVCIGSGVIFNAGQGDIEVESGAILGSEVLIIGKTHIGNKACIGSCVTIFQTSVPAMTVVASGSILGDISRQVNLVEISAEPVKKTHHEEYPSLWDEPEEDTKETHTTTNTNNNSDLLTPQTPSTSQNNLEQSSPQEEIKSVDISELDTNGEKLAQTKGVAIGQVYINQLLFTLFPHKQNSK
jgi:carbon dioxide concentrating mechanism protein CcmN